MGDLNQGETQAQEKLLPWGLPLKARNTNSQLVFEPQSQRPRLTDDEVEAQILVSKLQRSTSGSRLLVCGTVLRVGSRSISIRWGGTLLLLPTTDFKR